MKEIVAFISDAAQKGKVRGAVTVTPVGVN
jgi:hypothetical protein